MAAVADRIPLVIRIGDYTFNDGLITGKRYQISRAWMHRDPQIQREKKDAVLATFPWLDRVKPLMAQQPSISITMSLDVGGQEMFDEFDWNGTGDQGDPVERSWDAATIRMTWTLRFPKTPDPAEVENRAYDSAWAMYLLYIEASPRAREIFRDLFHDYNTKTGTPIYALGKSVVAHHNTTAAAAVVRNKRGRLFVADATTLKPLCDHVHGEDLPFMQAQTGLACPSCCDSD